MKLTFYILITLTLWLLCPFYIMGNEPFIRIYKTEFIGRHPKYLTLKQSQSNPYDNQFDYFNTQLATFCQYGSWIVFSDTLQLFTNLEFGNQIKSQYITKDLPDMLRSTMNINRKFLIKENWRKLIDITDYSTIFPDDEKSFSSMFNFNMEY